MLHRSALAGGRVFGNRVCTAAVFGQVAGFEKPSEGDRRNGSGPVPGPD